MPKEPVSVTLDRDNLLWLRARAAARKRRSVSEALDALVTEARLAGQVSPAGIRTVVGTVDITASDPGLDEADAAIQSLLSASLGRSLSDRHTASEQRRTKPSLKRRRRG